MGSFAALLILPQERAFLIFALQQRDGVAGLHALLGRFLPRLGPHISAAFFLGAKASQGNDATSTARLQISLIGAGGASGLHPPYHRESFLPPRLASKMRRKVGQRPGNRSDAPSPIVRPSPTRTSVHRHVSRFAPRLSALSFAARRPSPARPNGLRPAGD